ncbi:hypothetical protein [Bacillus toyonensis]|uniref:hypothetical protein n=1 Tax=Bacillus toyonensis TaxID=155322 RepID=UPI00399D4B10
MSSRQDTKASKYFLQKSLASYHAAKPRVITVESDKPHPVTIKMQSAYTVCHFV